MRHTSRVRSRGHQRSTERAGALRAVTALSGFDQDELARIDDLGTEVRRAAGSVLQRAGSTVRQAFVVLDGLVVDQPPVGRESVAGLGHGVGFEALAERVPRARTKVVALTDVRVLVFGPLELADVAAIERSRRVVPSMSTSRRRSLHRAPAPAWASTTSAMA